jgi:hypothetical protein
MNISDIISDSIRYPSSDWTKVIILGVIFLASFLVIPIFLVIGYVFRIIKATIAGINELPEFDEIGDMFIDGLKVFAVGIVYAIPVWILNYIFLLIYNPGINAANAAGSMGPALIWGLIAANIVLIIIGLIVGLIAVMGIANMAYYDGELGAAFRFSEILDKISRIGWGKYLVTYIVIALIGFIVYLVAAIVGIVLLIIGIFLTLPLAMSYISMFGYRAIALLYASTVE